APCLKTIEGATEIRRRILTAFERAEAENGPAPSPWLTFVIVGGGATGVEMAGAISEVAHETLRNEFRSIHPEQAQVILLDRASRLVPAFSERLSAKAENELLRLGVRVRCGVRVTEIDENGVTLQCQDGTVTAIPSKTVLWAGGVSVAAI